jgi:hypothetical protein
MQPRKLLPDAEAVLVDAADDDALDDVLDDGALDELVPHAASSRLVAAVAAAAIHALCFTVPPVGPGCQVPRHHGTPPSPRLPERVKPVNVPCEEPRGHCGRVVAESRPTGC